MKTVKTRLNELLSGSGLNGAQVKAMDYLSNGFRPDDEVELVTVGKTLNCLVKRIEELETAKDCLGATLADETNRADKAEVTLSQLRKEHTVVEKMCADKDERIKNLAIRLRNAEIQMEVYKNALNVNYKAKKIVDKVTLTVMNFFCMPGSIPLTRTSNVSVEKGGQYIENIDNQDNNYGRRKDY